MNQSLLHSLETTQQDSIDQLYVNSVIANIRETSSHENRGRLWESLHKSLLQLKASRAALESVAAAGGAAELIVLKHETKQLFIQLKKECREFCAEDSPTAVPEPTTATLPTSPTPTPRGTSVIDRALGSATEHRLGSARKDSAWTYKDRNEVATALLKKLRSLGVLSVISLSYGCEQQLLSFVRDHILLRIEPCKAHCLTSLDVSNLVVDLLISHSSRLPVSIHERNQLNDWRGSSILSTTVSKILIQWTRKHTKNRNRGRRSKQIRFQCSNMTIAAAANSIEEDDSVRTIRYNAIASSADAVADRLLHQLKGSIKTMSPKNSRVSFEVSRTIDV